MNSAQMDSPTFIEVVIYLFYGMGLVLGTLALLWLITSVMSACVRKSKWGHVGSAAESSEDQIPEAVIAAITAAVTLTFGNSASIKSVKKK